MTLYKISRMLPRPTPPPNLIVKVVFDMLLVEPKLCTKFEVANFNGYRNKWGVPNCLYAKYVRTIHF